MPIPVSCPCGFSAEVPDTFVGRSVKCRRCGERVTVSSPVPAWPDAEPDVAQVIPELDVDGVDFPTVDVNGTGAENDRPASPASSEAHAARADASWPRRELGTEPWYYGFLVGYAVFIACSGCALGIIWLLLSVAAYAGSDPKPPPLVLAAAAAPGVAAILGALLIAAPILLAVDAARNLRALRAGR
jgi:hypothetical protein